MFPEDLKGERQLVARSEVDGLEGAPGEPNEGSIEMSVSGGMLSLLDRLVDVRQGISASSSSKQTSLANSRACDFNSSTTRKEFPCGQTRIQSVDDFGPHGVAGQ